MNMFKDIKGTHGYPEVFSHIYTDMIIMNLKDTKFLKLYFFPHYIVDIKVSFTRAHELPDA